jgi:hypothetical protein
MMAKVLLLDSAHLNKLAREGIVPRSGHSYHLVPTVQAYVRYLRQDGSDSDRESLLEEKTKLTRVQRQKAEFALAVLRRDYLPIVEVQEVIAAALKSLAAGINTLPDVLERDTLLEQASRDRLQIVLDELREQLYQRLLTLCPAEVV